MFIRSIRSSFFSSSSSLSYFQSHSIFLRSFSLSSYGKNVYGGQDITSSSLETFSLWHQAIEIGTEIKEKENKEENNERKKQIFQQLETKVDSNCLFSPPTYYKRWKGKEEFLCIIESVGEVFGSSFRYNRQWLSNNGQDWALEFTAKIGSSDLIIEGIDLVKLDENGKIIEFSVLARPPSAVAELKNQMMKKAGPKLVAIQAKKSISSFFGSSN